MTLNVHIYPSTCEHETRILKITRTLKKAGVFSKIVILGRLKAGLSPSDSLDEVREIIRLPSLGQKDGGIKTILRFALWNLQCLFFLIRNRAGCVNCHSLSVLPLGVLAKAFTRSKLIYDTHELETETMNASGFRRVLARIVESVCIRFADGTVVVNDSIKEWYEKRYSPQNLIFIRNYPCVIPQTNQPATLRAFLDIDEKDLLFLYQGLIDEGRGIRNLLESFSKAPSNLHIVFIGYGSLVGLVEEYATRHSNIHYHPAVPPEELLRYSAAADIGVACIEAACTSYELCLPNKLFEYLQAGLPVMVTPRREMKQLVEEYDCGWVLTDGPVSFRSFLQSIDANEINSKRSGVIQARSDCVWEKEEPTLLKLYNSMNFLAE